MKRKAFFLGLTLLLAVNNNAHAVTETMAEYQDSPIFLSNSVEPNILIILSNSGTMNQMAYADAYDPTATYYGYFTSTYNYRYSSNTFFIEGASSGPPAAEWSGSFLNWAAMRRIDVGRKVLMGGKATSRTGGGNQHNVGESSGADWDAYKCGKASDAAALAKYTGDRYGYMLSGNNLEVWDFAAAAPIDAIATCDDFVALGSPLSDASNIGSYADLVESFNINVEKLQAYESDDFYWNGSKWELGGVMQQVKDKARWGLEYYNNNGCGIEAGCGGGTVDGGYIKEEITGTGYGTNMITSLSNTTPGEYQPIAEALTTAYLYYAHDSSKGYANDYGLTTDPFDYSGSLVRCPKNFVILITDGTPSKDTNIDGSVGASSILSGYDDARYDYYQVPSVGDSNNDLDGDGSYRTDYADDVAYYAHTTDLRSDADLYDTQSMTIYVVYAFGTDPNAEMLLKEVAKNGGFVNSDSDPGPNLQSEFDADGDGNPDTYFSASDGPGLKTQLMAAITDILKRATSGTAISVLATSASGAGSIFQAYFLPSKTILDASGAREVNWIGHLLSFNIDAYGHLRNADLSQCISFYFDDTEGQTFVKFFSEGSDGICPDSPGTTTSKLMTDLSAGDYIWEAGSVLRDRNLSSSPRNIYTSLNDGAGFIDFDTSNESTLRPYIEAADATEGTNIIKYVQGFDVSGYRDRTIDGGEWKLGDIVHSTPTVVGAPGESFDILYGDTTYKSYFNGTSRDTIVYVGANDGMLHAFNADTGVEEWAFIPYNILPHLQWLKESAYSHVNYVDLKVRVTDVKDGSTWKTILIGGMRFGGAYTTDSNSSANTMRSAYFAINITDPDNPTLMWEFTDSSLGFSFSYPTVVKVDTSWFAIIGSGPNNLYTPTYDSISTQTGKLFILNVFTGALQHTITASNTGSFFSDPISVDTDLDVTGGVYSSDAIYVAETWCNKTTGPSGGLCSTTRDATREMWDSKIWRITTDASSPGSWSTSTLFTLPSNQTITSAPAVASDDDSNLWIFFGAGKYIDATDKTNDEQQSFYGIRDPCVTNASLDTSCTTEVTISQLADTSGVLTGVKLGGDFLTSVEGKSTFAELETEIETNLQGWYLDFPGTTSGSPSERSLNKPVLLGGLVMFTSFTPNDDQCGFGGESYFYSLFYKTGTAFTQSTIGTTTVAGQEVVLARSETAMTGMASSIAIHSGREDGAKALVQISTGEATTISFQTAINIKSGIISWKEIGGGS